jgi:hypothetical protein
MSPTETEDEKERSKGQQIRWVLRIAGMGLGFVVISFAVSWYVIRFPVLDDLGFFDPTQIKSTDTLAQIRGDIWQKLLGCTALLLGAGWALTHFVLKRTNEAALKIDMTTPRIIIDKGRVLFVSDVVLENIGGVRIGAQPRRYQQKNLLPAYQHQPYEILDFSVSMLIQPLPKTGYAQTAIKDLGKQSGTLDWFAEFDSKLKPKNLVAEINLIDSYEVDDDKVNFWMEPSEIYHLPVTLEMEPGNYWAMVTFIGARGEFEFWRRFFVIQVNPPPPRSLLQEVTGFVTRLLGSR